MHLFLTCSIPQQHLLMRGALPQTEIPVDDGKEVCRRLMIMHPFSTMPVLIANEDTDDCLMVMEAWEETGLAHKLRFVQDGAELMDYLYQQGRFRDPHLSPKPGLILLSLTLSRKNGWEALAEIQTNPTVKKIPLVVCSPSKSADEVSRAFSLGASAFITKPDTFHEYLDIMRDLRQAWLETGGLTSIQGGTWHNQKVLSLLRTN